MINFQNVDNTLLFAMSYIPQLESAASSFEDSDRAKQFIGLLDNIRNVLGAEIESQGSSDTL